MSPLLEGILRSLAEGRRRREGSWSDPGFVFLSPSGRRIEERNFNRAWYRVRRVGAELGVRPLRLHDARHTFASLALSAGKPLPWVSKTIGHRRVSTTADIYSHVLPTDAVDLGFLPGIPTAGDRRGSFSRNKPSRLATAGATPRDRNASDALAREGLTDKK